MNVGIIANEERAYEWGAPGLAAGDGNVTENCLAKVVPSVGSTGENRALRVRAPLLALGLAASSRPAR